MDIEQLLVNVQGGTTSVQDALNTLKYMPYDELGYATIDYHRQLRNGVPEVIYCEGKTVAQVAGIVDNMILRGTQNILGTRADRKYFEPIKEKYEDATYFEQARIITIERQKEKKSVGTILVVSGGTSDINVCEEAAITAEFLGNNVTRLYDVGVAGVHRLLSKLDYVKEATVIIVVAGMEGALASVVGGLTDKPVIAVPTSVGYGASFGGVAALLSMLNSCASGVSVVNIDNGFGAGYIANSINKLKG